MAFLTRDQILQANDRPTKIVAVPEWGGDVIVRGLTGAQRDKFEQDSVERKGDKIETNLINMRARLVALCVVDENNQRLFQDSDVKELGRKSAAALERVFDVARELSGLKTQDVAELAENLDDGQNDKATLD